MAEEIPIKFWYEDVVLDVDKVIDAIEYWKHVYASGLPHAKMKGVLHQLLERQPGLMPLYEDTLTDAQMIHKWLEEEVKYLKSKKRIAYQHDPELKAEYGADLKKTDIDNYVLVDEDVRYLIQLQLMVELWVSQLNNLKERLTKRSIYLTMISKLRIAGEHEAFIDTTHETNPETLR
jgi:hypothetical protein